MLANLGPKGGGMIGMVNMGKFMNDDIVAKGLGDIHEADIERDDDRAIWMMGAGAPASIGMRKADLVIMIAIEFSEII